MICWQSSWKFQKWFFAFIWRCLLGSRKGIRPVKTEWCGAGMVVCLELGADLHMSQLTPLPLTVCCFSKIQIGFFVLVLAHLGSPRKRAVKRVCVQSFKAVKSCRKDLYMVRCKSVCDYRLLSEHVLVMISVPVISFMLHSLLIIMIIEVE